VQVVPPAGVMASAYHPPAPFAIAENRQPASKARKYHALLTGALNFYSGSGININIHCDQYHKRTGFSIYDDDTVLYRCPPGHQLARDLYGLLKVTYLGDVNNFVQHLVRQEAIPSLGPLSAENTPCRTFSE
jgi:hypothetical protein